MTSVKIVCCAALLLFHFESIHAHVFNLYADTNEEMKDSVDIRLSAGGLLIVVESVYSGQIAPHVRFMADKNGDKKLSLREIAAFFREYEADLEKQLPDYPAALDGKPLALAVRSVTAPAIANDDFVADVTIKAVISVKGLALTRGAHKLAIDPRLLFQIGNQFIDYAKDRAAFTEQQENAIARFIQVKMTGETKIYFQSVYPGYVDANKKTIFGIFFDKTAIRVQFLPYTKLETAFKVE